MGANNCYFAEAKNYIANGDFESAFRNLKESGYLDDIRIEDVLLFKIMLFIFSNSSKDQSNHKGGSCDVL